MKKSTFLLIILSTGSLTGCGVVSKLSNVGDPPDMSQIQDPTLMNGYRPVTMPMPMAEPEQRNVNSLWQTGSRAFLKDQRANRVGDVITVMVKINDKAKIDSNNTYNRQANQSVGVPNLFGVESKFKTLLPKAANLTTLTNTNSTTNSVGKGSFDRKDNLDIKIGATIIQVLPNGNLVIQGRQEVLFETELRIIDVRGVIRREDIASDNTIPYSKIAEARIAYGGRGDITDVSSISWGQQAMNRIWPW